MPAELRLRLRNGKVISYLFSEHKCQLFHPVLLLGAPPINKMFYRENPEVAGLSSAQVEDIWYNTSCSTLTHVSHAT